MQIMNNHADDVICTIVDPFVKGKSVRDTVITAIQYTKKTGNEVAFEYNYRTRRLSTPITAGNCRHTGEIDRQLAGMDAGIFHTHVQEDRGQPCLFSSTDLQYFFQCSISEALLGCVDPNAEETEFVSLDLRVPMSDADRNALIDDVRECNTNHYENPYPCYPQIYQKMLKRKAWHELE